LGRSGPKEGDEQMRTIEHTVDVWDLAGMDRRLDVGMLVKHLRDLGEEGWELVWMGPNLDLADHHGPCHVLVFKRVLDDPVER
jgi:hypothetical protein